MRKPEDRSRMVYPVRLDYDPVEKTLELRGPEDGIVLCLADQEPCIALLLDVWTSAAGKVDFSPEVFGTEGEE